MNVEDLITVCERKRVRIDAINLLVGTLMIDRTGVVGRGSAATALAGGVVPVLRPDNQVLQEAETFIIHPERGDPLMLSKAEIEEFLR
jgi:hypothetical protein